MRRRSLLASLAAVPAASAKPFDAPFRKQMEQLMAVGPVPGMVIGVVEKGRAPRIEAIGTCAVGGPPVTADSIFQAASLTKQVTAHVVLALRDQGAVDLDKPLTTYVDDIQDERSRRATLRHVLSHSAGFPNWRFEKGSALVADFEPGSRWQYSGEGFVYLQRIIEKLTGKPFAQVGQEMVFEPLGMRSSALRWKPEFEGRFALPHRRRGELVEKWDKDGRAAEASAKRLGHELRYVDSIAVAVESGGRALPNWIVPNAAASMMTTANDYAKFLTAATGNPELRREQITMRSGKDWLLGWGLGWGIERVAGHEYLWQWGDNGGYKNVVFAEPSRGRAVFVFTNGDAGARLYDRVVTHMTGHEHPALFWI